MTFRDGKYSAQLHLYVSTKTIKDLDQLIDVGVLGGSRSAIVRELVETAWHEHFDPIYEAKMKEE